MASASISSLLSCRRSGLQSHHRRTSCRAGVLLGFSLSSLNAVSSACTAFKSVGMSIFCGRAGCRRHTRCRRGTLLLLFSMLPRLRWPRSFRTSAPCSRGRSCRGCRRRRGRACSRSSRCNCCCRERIVSEMDSMASRSSPESGTGSEASRYSPFTCSKVDMPRESHGRWGGRRPSAAHRRREWPQDQGR